MTAPHAQIYSMRLLACPPSQHLSHSDRPCALCVDSCPVAWPAAAKSPRSEKPGNLSSVSACCSVYCFLKPFNATVPIGHEEDRGPLHRDLWTVSEPLCLAPSLSPRPLTFLALWCGWGYRMVLTPHFHLPQVQVNIVKLEEATDSSRWTSMLCGMSYKH